MVTGEGFPERRRVRLLLTEDLAHYLSKAGQSPPRQISYPNPAASRDDRVGTGHSGGEGQDEDRVAKERSAAKVMSNLFLTRGR